MATEAACAVSTSSNESLDQFLTVAGWAGATRSSVQKDASTRHFMRLTKPDGQVAILMEARPPMDDIQPFLFMQKKLSRLGLSVPKVYAHDIQNHFVLQEDFGEVRYFELLKDNNTNPAELYQAAIETLVCLATADPEIALQDSTAFGWEYWENRVRQFLIHYVPAYGSSSLSAAAEAEYMQIFQNLIAQTEKLPPVLVHGDFEAQNLFYFPDRQAPGQCGLIDFEDFTPAKGNMMATPAFDLMHVLQSPRLKNDFEKTEHYKRMFCEAANITDTQQFDQDFAILAVALALKCLGFFTRVGQENARYLTFIPNCWEIINYNISHAALTPLKGWLQAHIPDSERVSHD